MSQLSDTRFWEHHRFRNRVNWYCLISSNTWTKFSNILISYQLISSQILCHLLMDSRRKLHDTRNSVAKLDDIFIQKAHFFVLRHTCKISYKIPVLDEVRRNGCREKIMVLMKCFSRRIEGCKTTIWVSMVDFGFANFELRDFFKELFGPHLGDHLKCFHVELKGVRPQFERVW